MRLSDRSRGLTVGVLVTVAFVAAALIGAWVGHVIETRNAEVATQTDQKEAVTDAYVAVNDRCAESDGCVPGPSAAEVIRGVAGADGPQGERGDKGERGPRGDRGPAGPTGAVGPAGTDGADGVNGVDGVNGIDGQPGAQGPAGPQGETGATGPQGEPGPKGDTGNPGTDGQTCPSGSQLAAVTYASGETGYGCVVPASVKNSGRQERQ